MVNITQGFYPIRERSRLISEFKFLIEQLMMLKAFVDFPGDTVCISFSLLPMHLLTFAFLAIDYVYFFMYFIGCSLFRQILVMLLRLLIN